MRPETLLLAKIAPPRPYRRLLSRPALEARLHDALDYRVTLVQAGTGYGKTTALLALAAADLPLCWYSLGESDSDPQTFLSYLIATCSAGLPGLSDLPAAMLQEQPASDGTWKAVLDALLNALTERLRGPALLVLDDYHFVAGSPEIRALTDRLISYAPPELHLVLASRYPISGGELLRWRARGEVLAITREELAFNETEIATLFGEVYGIRLNPAEIAALAEQTEGWPIALQLVWQGLRSGAARSVTDLLANELTSLAALFDYLAGDVLDQQQPDLASFLRETAVLRELSSTACDAVREANDSAILLGRLRDLDLFIVEMGEGHFRYHHVFRDFLLQEARSTARERHRRAARFYAAQGDDPEAIYHWLAAHDDAEAAAAVTRAGEAALRSGLLDTLAVWIAALPAGVIATYPRLLSYLGDIYRLRSRFDEARSWYRQAAALSRARGDQAGISYALHGQALIYIDQVQPAQAERLLQEALWTSDSLDDRAARADLLELLAENKLNMGHPNEAETLRSQARALREEGPTEDLLSVRVKLRTGRLTEARTILEGWYAEERRAADRGRSAPPRGHRETVLLLSLIHSFSGELDLALDMAREGIKIGERLGSPFVTAVSHTRAAHALQLRAAGLPGEAGQEARNEALCAYEATITLGDKLAVRRLRAEAMWGFTRAYGFFGDIEAARRTAAEGIAICRWAGDPWVAAMIELTLGASQVLAERYDEAVKTLDLTLAHFHECNDSFSLAATHLWLALSYAELRQEQPMLASLDELLELCASHGYDFLLTRPGMLGPPDTRCLLPLLLTARAQGLRGDYVGRLLASLGLSDLQSHPGYQLRVQTLGSFRVWRGSTEIEARDWQRDKARQLFQLLITHRGRWLQRDEIADLLWPELAPDAAGRDFKVALNALNKAIEPARAADAAYAFIVRDGGAYRLRPEADIWIDSVEFADRCAEGHNLLDSGQTAAGIARLSQILERYRGDYLPESVYEDWTSAERERLRTIFLRAAERLALNLGTVGRDGELIDICARILEQDSCWERAYRLQILAYARQGNRPLALRTYQRCVDTLQSELGLDPAPVTYDLYQRIKRGDETLPSVTEL